MPFFEHNYAGELALPNGTKKRVPPDRILRDLGPLLAVAVSVTPQHADRLSQEGRQAPQPVSGYALIDTGASVTAVDERICAQLDLQATGKLKMAHAGGAEDRPCFPIQISFPMSPLPPVTIHRAVSCKLQPTREPQYIALFERDLLARLRFVYNGPAGRIELAF